MLFLVLPLLVSLEGTSKKNREPGLIIAEINPIDQFLILFGSPSFRVKVMGIY